ncbi:MAG: TonB-dependent receptor plug domain-containing protein [Myxococcota bacterium]
MGPKNLLLSVGLLATPLIASAQSLDRVDDIAELSLEDLLNSETEVASKTTTTLRETPGIVTVVTREEIVRSGARDLLDVLQLVPGMQFAMDVQGSLGLAVRGNWGHEGKVLLLWDGIELNETLYLSSQFGNHFPVHTIERIEIIRGPGSSLYGGFAELGVINVITRGAKLQGAELMAQYGHMNTSFARATGGLAYGKEYEGLFEGLEVSVDVFGGEGVRSDGLYQDGYGTEYRLDWSNAQASPTFANAVIRYKGLETRLLVDLYRTRQRDEYDEAAPEAMNNLFYTYAAQVKYDWTPAAGIRLTPLFSAKRQLPWAITGVFGEMLDESTFYQVTVDRMLGNLVASVNVMDRVSLVSGFEARLDHASKVTDAAGELVGDNDYFVNGQSTIDYWNLASFAQLFAQTEFVNVAAGARVEYHSQYGVSFVPRIAMTKVMDRLHAKLLVSGAFKAPGIANIDLNPAIKPERTQVAEAELGYELLDNLYLSANVFDIEIQDPIIYNYDDATESESYLNSPRTGSRGAELELRLRDSWGYATFGYSYASTEGKNEVPLYDAGRPDVLRGLAGHKFTANTSFVLTPSLSLNPSAVILSERYGWLGAEDGSVGRAPPVALLNVVLRQENVFLDGLDATLGVYNALNVQYGQIQAYDSGHAPYPGRTREIMGQLVYRFGL